MWYKSKNEQNSSSAITRLAGTSIDKFLENSIDKPWAIFTSHNKIGMTSEDKKSNTEQQQKLKYAIVEMGLGFVITDRTWICEDEDSPEFMMRKNSLFVPNVDMEDAVMLSNEYNHDCLIIEEDSTYQLINATTEDFYED